MRLFQIIRGSWLKHVTCKVMVMVQLSLEEDAEVIGWWGGGDGEEDEDEGGKRGFAVTLIIVL